MEPPTAEPRPRMLLIIGQADGPPERQIHDRLEHWSAMAGLLRAADVGSCGYIAPGHDQRSLGHPSARWLVAMSVSAGQAASRCSARAMIKIPPPKSPPNV